MDALGISRISYGGGAEGEDDSQPLPSPFPYEMVRSLPPNYPPTNPIFYVPSVPNLTKVTSFAAVKRAPVPGYDVKTLKKQVEFLQNEIENKVTTHRQLYRQNEELWTYTQQLLIANKANAEIVRNEMSRLHFELKGLYNDRVELAKKLELTQNSKIFIEQLTKDLAHITADSTGILSPFQHARICILFMDSHSFTSYYL